jgi:DNA-binding NarL/FixJ family response regulator
MTLMASVEAPTGRFGGQWGDHSMSSHVPPQAGVGATTVLVVSSYPVTRRGLEALLAEGNSECRVWAVASAPEANVLAATVQPSVIVIDGQLCQPVTAGAMCADLLAAAPAARLIVVASTANPATIRRCIVAGALVCLSPESDESVFKEAFAMARRGQRYVDARVAHALACNDDALMAVGSSRLTPRERDVLQLLSEGCSNRTISARLTISEKTVKGHVSSVLAKLNAPSRLAAALMAPTVL